MPLIYIWSLWQQLLEAVLKLKTVFQSSSETLPYCLFLKKEKKNCFHFSNFHICFVSILNNTKKLFSKIITKLSLNVKSSSNLLNTIFSKTYKKHINLDYCWILSEILIWTWHMILELFWQKKLICILKVKRKKWWCYLWKH